MSCIDKMILKTPQVMKVEKFLFEKKMPIKLVKLDEIINGALSQVIYPLLTLISPL